MFHIIEFQLPTGTRPALPPARVATAVRAPWGLSREAVSSLWGQGCGPVTWRDGSPWLRTTCPGHSGATQGPGKKAEPAGDLSWRPAFGMGKGQPGAGKRGKPSALPLKGWQGLPTPQARRGGRAVEAVRGWGRAGLQAGSVWGSRGGPGKMRGLWGPPEPLLESTLCAVPVKRIPQGDHAVRGSASHCPSQTFPSDPRGCHGDTAP